MDKIEEKIAKKLIKKKITIAVAESCTGGSISKKLTDTAGSSEYFKGSIVAYSNNIKENFLDVKSDILLDKGAVSSEVASMMAENIRKKFNTDIGISTTGISGPSGGTKAKPLGLIYIALSTKKEQIVKKFIFRLERKEHRKAATYKALDMINSLIKK
jgi:nicotinamide-nucleotide amidase